MTTLDFGLEVEKSVTCLYCDQEEEHEVEDNAMQSFLHAYCCPNGCPKAFYISRDDEKYCVDCDGFYNPYWHVCFQIQRAQWLKDGKPASWIPSAWDKWNKRNHWEILRG